MALFLEGLDAFKRDLVFFFFVEDKTVFFAAMDFFLFDAFFCTSYLFSFCIKGFFRYGLFIFFWFAFLTLDSPLNCYLPLCSSPACNRFFLDFVFTLTLELLVDFFDFTVFLPFFLFLSPS